VGPSMSALAPCCWRRETITHTKPLRTSFDRCNDLRRQLCSHLELLRIYRRVPQLSTMRNFGHQANMEGWRESTPPMPTFFVGGAAREARSCRGGCGGLCGGVSWCHVVWGGLLEDAISHRRSVLCREALMLGAMTSCHSKSRYDPTLYFATT
jgi:hypothetical protein